VGEGAQHPVDTFSHEYVIDIIMYI